MLATVFVMLAVLGAVPLWLTAAVLARDCIIVAGAISYRLSLGAVVARPSKISKFNTLCQISLILVVIGVQQFSWPAVTATALGALVFVTVVVSGIDYVLVYGRLALAQSKARHSVARAGGSKPA
jgi:cardiolipin synthase